MGKIRPFGDICHRPVQADVAARNAEARYPVRRPAPHPRRAISAYYGASVAEFLTTASETVIGVLAMADMQGALDAEQRRAWAEEIDVLRTALAALGGTLFLEFDAPPR